jgi:hypothetical protein
VVGRGRIVELLDKGKDKGAVLYAERTIIDKASGEKVATLTSAAMLRGDGGFGGKPGPQPGAASHSRWLAHPPPRHQDLSQLGADLSPLRRQEPPARRPEGRRGRRLQDADPARAVHLRRGRARHRQGLLRQRPGQAEEPAGALLRAVFPGETIRTEMWPDGKRISFRARAWSATWSCSTTGWRRWRDSQRPLVRAHRHALGRSPIAKM